MSGAEPEVAESPLDGRRELERFVREVASDPDADEALRKAAQESVR